MTEKYKPLYEYLVKMSNEGHTSWHASFAEIECIIGSSLPPSARARSLFWSNLRQPNRASTAWFMAGWKASNVDIADETVLFLINR